MWHWCWQSDVCARPCRRAKLDDQRGGYAAALIIRYVIPGQFRARAGMAAYAVHGCREWAETVDP